MFKIAKESRKRCHIVVYLDLEVLIIRAATYRSLRWTPPFPEAFTLEVSQTILLIGGINPNQVSELFLVNTLQFLCKRRPYRSGEVYTFWLEMTTGRDHSIKEVVSELSGSMKNMK